MAYKITCKDAGMPTCPFEVVAETQEEAMKIAGGHTESTHKMKMTPEMAEKVKKIIRKV